MMGETPQTAGRAALPRRGLLRAQYACVPQFVFYPALQAGDEGGRVDQALQGIGGLWDC